MVSDVRMTSSPAVSALDHALPGDPWDAPYFGAPVYLAYQAAPMPAPATVPAGLAADPWDAPYFGAPAFFRYPDYPVAVAVPAGAPVASELPMPEPDVSPTVSDSDGEVLVAAAKTEVVVALPQARKQRSWLARLFGR
jgi:hypothetical protein